MAVETSSENNKRVRIGVIGGGIAGLTAAYRLAAAGHDVILWERAERIGGQAAAFPLLDTALEYFYHHLFTSDRAIAELIGELGLSERLIWPTSNVGFFQDGKIFPLNGATDLLKLDFIPLIDRIRIGAVTLLLQRTKSWKKFERVTTASWLRRMVGNRAFNRVWGAQLKAKFGPRYDEVAMVWFWNKIFLRTQSRKSPLAKEHLGYILGSFNVLIDRLGEAIEEKGGVVKAGVGTNALERSDHGWTATTTEGDVIERDIIVATVPSPILLRMVPELPDDYKRKLTGAIYQGAITMVLQSRRPLSNIYWLNIGDPSVPFTGVIEHTNLISPDHYQGWHLIYAGKYVEQDHPYMTMSDEDLFEEYIPYLERINPEFDRDWIENYWVFRERAAQPIITLHYSERIPSLRTPLPGLYLANTSQIYPEDRGTNYSVRLGNDVARLVDDDLSAVKIPVTAP